MLVVCTETYYRRFRGHEVPGKGKGVDWEGAIITQEIYDARSRTLKFVPVFLSAANEDWIPEPLRSVNYYKLTSESGYEGLCDFLLGVAGVEARPVGMVKKRERRKGTPLSFAGEEENAGSERRMDISRILKYAPAQLIGREAETKLLSDAWAKPFAKQKGRPHILTFVALGRRGEDLTRGQVGGGTGGPGLAGVRRRLCLVLLQPGHARAMAAPVRLVPQGSPRLLRRRRGQAVAAGNAGAFEKGRRLARLVGGRRGLLILDGLEPLQYAPTSPTPGELKDQGIAALLKGLAATSHGLCIVTTRYSHPGLARRSGRTPRWR